MPHKLTLGPFSYLPLLSLQTSRGEPFANQCTSTSNIHSARWDLGSAYRNLRLTTSNQTLGGGALTGIGGAYSNLLVTHFYHSLVGGDGLLPETSLILILSKIGYEISIPAHLWLALKQTSNTNKTPQVWTQYKSEKSFHLSKSHWLRQLHKMVWCQSIK